MDWLFLKEIFSKDISEHIPYMMGVVGTGTKKINTTRLSEVFIPYAVLAYIIFGGMSEIKTEIKNINNKISAIEKTQVVSTSHVDDLKDAVGEITSTLQKIGWSRLTK